MRYLHTMLRVLDLDAALAFFVGKLGLREARREEHERGRFTLVFLESGAGGTTGAAGGDAGGTTGAAGGGAGGTTGAAGGDAGGTTGTAGGGAGGTTGAAGGGAGGTTGAAGGGAGGGMTLKDRFPAT